MPQPLETAPATNSPDTLSSEEFQLEVKKAREAIRARMGIGPDSPTTLPAHETPQPPPAPVATYAPPPQPTPAPVATYVPTPQPTPAPVVEKFPAPRLMKREPPAQAAPAFEAVLEPHTRSTRWRLSMVSLCLIAIAGIVGAVVYFKGPGQAVQATAATAQGTVKIVTRPEGAEVIVDGVSRGFTPMTLSLGVGEHLVDLRQGATHRSIPLTIAGGAVIEQHIDLAATPTQATGKLEVTSDPPGAQVSVDGTPRGAAPLSLADITPGQHRVVISNGDATVTRNVEVTAGNTASVVASLAPSGVSAGWVSLNSPLALEIFQNGRQVGAKGIDRVMLPTGRHELEVASSEYEFRSPVTVQVQPGKTTTVNINLPGGTLSINALPWAEVWLDGKPMGTTPLANLSLLVGPHEIIWRHPQFGERRQTVKITAQSPVRAAVDFSK